MPRTARAPYSHVESSTPAELDQLGLTALRAMVDVEPYSSSDLGVDLSDEELPSPTSGSPSEDDDPEDPKKPVGQKEKEKEEQQAPRETRIQGG